MKDTPRRARDLTPEQLSELVMRRKQGRGSEPRPAAVEPEIRRRGATLAPLSFAQQRLWLLDQLEPGSAAYNLAAPVRLRGALAPAVLAACLTEIARRHESLRTHFELRGGDPVQVISPAAAFPLPLIDLSGLPAEIREAEGWRLARLDAAASFDLARGLLVRAHLLRLSGEEHMLLVCMHHVISDGWSVGLLFRELSVLYDAWWAGRPSPLDEPPIQYADFSLWQREWLQGAALQEQLAYWHRQLQGAPAALELPTDRLRPAMQSHRGEHLALRIPAGLATGLRELSRRHRATLFMTMLAACKILLQRWAGQDDVVVGSPSAGRQRMETEALIGFFLNTLVLRTDLSGGPGFLTLLERVREVVLGAYRYQDVPFERLLEELQVERQLSRSPLFQVLFNMITLPEMRLDLEGLRVEPLGAPETPAKFDFTLYVEERNGEIACDLLYNADLFERERMEAFLAQYLHVLTQIVAAPEAPITALSLVPADAASRLPDPRRPLPDAGWPGPVHERLSLHAARAPQREAVADGAESWTYGELEARASQLAHRLREAGVGRGDVVAIFAQRNASLAWAVLGTLKAGSAFLILDPSYPSARLLDYLEIARPVAWLAARGAGEPPAEVAAAVAALAPRLRLELPPLSQAAAEGTLAGYPTTPPEVAVGPDDLACVGLHLRLHRPSQGGRRPPRRPLAVPALVGGALRAGGGRPLRDALGALARSVAARPPDAGLGGGEPAHPRSGADGGAGVADLLGRPRGGHRPPPHPGDAGAGDRRRDGAPAAPAPGLRGRRPAPARRGGAVAADRAGGPLRQSLRLDRDPALGRLLGGARGRARGRKARRRCRSAPASRGSSCWCSTPRASSPGSARSARSTCAAAGSPAAIWETPS